MGDLLFEIGTEELPARVGPRAVEELARLAANWFHEQQLECQVQTLGTPRRLVLLARDIPDKQADVQETVVGPPLKAGDRARDGFARKYGVDGGKLQEREGRYVLDREVKGKTAAALAPQLCETLLRGLSFPKPMRWSDGTETFARPIIWLLALLDGRVVEFSFAGVASGNETRGHRFHAPKPVAVSGPDDYVAILENSHVVLDASARREQAWAGLEKAASAAGLRLRCDDGLLDEVTWLVEKPTVVLGSFDVSYLELPEVVIVSAMRTHQRYFALEDSDGKLANRFLAVAGTQPRDLDIVRRGNERVLAARLADARFFFQEDQKTKLADLTDRLRGVVFQKKLGTVYEKVARVAALGIVLAKAVGAEADKVAKSAQLCKADLQSHMVGEFPDLQGAMGRVYARAEGVDAEVAEAIYEHYLPRYAGDDLPKTATGAVLALADRLDTLVGCFGEGVIPTGTADPYGLRRASIGISRILTDQRWRIPVGQLLELAAQRYGGRYDQAVEPARAFVVTRLRGLMADVAPTDVVEAVLAAGGDDVVDLRDRVSALGQLRARADFEPLAATFKRVANILKGEDAGRGIDEARLHEGAEQALWKEVKRVRLDEARTADYSLLLERLVTLKPAVDRFFDDVLVMDKDEAVKKNRLALLGAINTLFLRVADFRQISV